MKTSASLKFIRFYIGLIAAIGFGSALLPYFLPEPYFTQVATFLYSEEYAIEGLNNLRQHPYQENAHRLFGVLLISTGLVQINSRIRKNSPLFHRLAGYFFFSCVFIISIGGMMMATLFPFAGSLETFTFTVLGMVLLYYTFKGAQQIWYKNWKNHELWMRRAFMIALSTMSLRLYAVFFIQLTSMSAADVLILSTWLGLITNIIVAEVWVRTISRKKKTVSKKAAPQKTAV